MIGAAILATLRATLTRWAKLVPRLFRHDPLFRYAAMAAALAVTFLVADLAQQVLAPDAIPPGDRNAENTPAAADRVLDNRATQDDASATTEPPPPGSTTARPTRDGAPPAIAPGRSLENLTVEPAPGDRFGTLPVEKMEQGGSSP